MAKNVMQDVRKKLADARTACPNMKEEVYLLTDYMSTVANNELEPIGVTMLLMGVLEDLKCGKGDFLISKSKELPDYLIKNKTQILAQAMLFPQIIDAIADEAFAKEFRGIIKEVYNWDVSKKVSPAEINNNFPTYVTVAVDWWANAVCNPKFDNGDDSQVGETMAMMAMLLGNSGEQLSQESISTFKKCLGEAIMQDLEKFHKEICLEVDYNPCIALAEAAQVAGISKNKFPWKTRMWVSNTEVIVRTGYETKYKTLWKT